jgi:long-chain acyl-CoA synthetase
LPAGGGLALPAMNLAACLTDTAARFPDRTALWTGEAELSYRLLDSRSARVAALVGRRGVNAGDRVGLMLPNVPELLIAYYGLLRAGATVVPMKVGLKEREVAYLATDAQATMLLAWHASAEAADAGARRAGTRRLFVTPGEFGRLLANVEPQLGVADREGTEIAVILYPPETAEAPREAELTHESLRRGAAAVLDRYGLNEEDVTLVGALPLLEAFGQTYTLNATILAGGCLAFAPHLDPREALRTIERARVTVLQGPPSMYAALLAHPERDSFDLSTLRLCVCAGAPMPVELASEIERAFGSEPLEVPTPAAVA